MPKSQKITIVLLLCLALAVIGFVVTVTVARDRTPEITRQELAAAESHWKKSGPKSYDLDLTKANPSEDKVHLEVRDSQVTACQIAGHTPDKRLWDSWTVKRQFEYIREDLEAQSQASDSDTLRLTGIFDKKFGFPQLYRSSATNKRPATGWRIVNFEVVAQ